VLRLLLSAVVLKRLARGRRMKPALAPGAPAPSGTVSVVIPARDEEARIAGTLGPLAGEPGVTEVVVVDDESTDRTAELARSFAARVVPGAPLPEGWAGKVWALEQGLRAARGEWVVFLDADTRPQRGLIAALVEAAGRVDLLSAGPRFVCEHAGERLLHPSFLTTIVYRTGPPGVEGWQPSARRAVINGQCVVVRREALLAAGGWGLVRDRMTEDVAIARALRARGWRIGFEDAADLLEVRMYETAAETWAGWGRSLMAPDVNGPLWQAVDLATLWLTMALPLPRLLARRGDRLDVLLAVVRLMLLAGYARAYRPRGLAFWLSPLADVPVMVRLTQSVLRPTRTWRGRTYARGTARRSSS
jgi:dolichol-phosphate mannosyltransferase